MQIGGSPAIGVSNGDDAANGWIEIARANAAETAAYKASLSLTVHVTHIQHAAHSRQCTPDVTPAREAQQVRRDSTKFPHPKPTGRASYTQLGQAGDTDGFASIRGSFALLSRSAV